MVLKDEAGGFATPLIMNPGYASDWIKAGWLTGSPGDYKVKASQKDLTNVIQLTNAFKAKLPKECCRWRNY